MSDPSKKSFDGQRRFRSHLTKSALLVIGASAAGLLLTSVALAIGSPTTPTGTRNPAASVVAPTLWTTPQNEIGAPSIPTPGGAAEGAGAFDSIICPTASLCIAVGGDSNLSGTVATSSNDGGAWSPGTVPAGLPEIKSVSCSSASHCVAVGSGVAIISSDGGATWSAHSIPTSNASLLGVSCPANTDTCVAVGVTPDVGGPLNGAIITSSDGGATWTAPTTKFPLAAIGGVSCASSTFCVAVGTQILVTGDAGQTWTQQFVDGGTGVLRTVSCSTSTSCVAIGVNPLGVDKSSSPGFEIQTTDGGSKWSDVNLLAGSWLVNALSCSNTGDCVLSGPSPNAAATPAWTSSDGGSTWSTDALPSTVSAVSSVSCYSASSCVYVGRSGANPISGNYSSSAGWSNTPVSSIFLTTVGSPS